MICEPIPDAGRRDRIWAKVLARCEIVLFEDKKTPCWLWTGPDSGKPGRGREKGRGHGYPRMSQDGATMAVHIVMWIIANGPIPPKKTLDHTCKRRLCVNPAHTEMVTHKLNCERRDGRRRAKPAKLKLIQGGGDAREATR